MPNSPFTRLVIFNIFWSIPWQVLRSAHHSSGDTSPTSSSLDHFAVSLSKQTDVVHVEGPQLDSCDIVRYTDQCCIGLKSQNESFTIRDLLMLPRIELIIKGLQKLRFPSFNSVAFPSLTLHWNLAFEFDIVYHTWTRWRMPAASLHSGSTFSLQQSSSAPILLELYQHFAWSCRGEDFQVLNSAQHAYLLHISSLSLKVDAVNSMKLLYQLKWD